MDLYAMFVIMAMAKQPILLKEPPRRINAQGVQNTQVSERPAPKIEPPKAPAVKANG